ncbi:MAG TPA: VOC family protein [Clostridia bacterium]|nr:VOC family protein [Clostridia bacterium]HPK16122.1 VOC family protein [Clostridia bacterium]
MIPNLTIGDLMIDCANAERARNFYANLTGWEKKVAFDCVALKTANGMTILFAETDIPYVPPVWPEEPGEQHKQMHLDFAVDDLQSAVDEAIRFGATKAAKQYGGAHSITLLDTEGHPFCLCKRQGSSEFDLYFKKRGFCMIPNPSINIDCRKTEILRGFYAQLTGWDQDFHWSALIADNGVVVHFMQCDFDYIPPVWPEEPGKQQKQMHFNFQVDDLPPAVEEAVRLGATKAAKQYGGAHYVTLLDTEGHPFCLCRR